MHGKAQRELTQTVSSCRYIKFACTLVYNLHVVRMAVSPNAKI